jgi:hypothetical protein
MMDGEKDRVATYLRHCRRVPVGGIERVKRPTWRKLARYVCPAPQVIVEKLLSLAFFWSGVVVPETGQAFFTSNWKQLFKKEVAYVQAGYLSDPPNLPMYRVRKTCSCGCGFIFYSSIRGTSALEGYHNSFNQFVSSFGKRAGLRWLELTTSVFDFRWTVRAGRKAQLYGNEFNKCGHYELWLIDLIVLLAARLPLAKQPFSNYRIVSGLGATTARLRHGNFFALQEMAPHLTPAKAAEHDATLLEGTETKWLSRLLESGVQLRTTPTADDMVALCANLHLWQDGETMAAFARERGLLLFKKSANALITTTLRDQPAWKLLLDKKYYSMLADVKTAAPQEAAQLAAFTSSVTPGVVGPSAPPVVPLLGGAVAVQPASASGRGRARSGGSGAAVSSAEPAGGRGAGRGGGAAAGSGSAGTDKSTVRSRKHRANPEKVERGNMLKRVKRLMKIDGITREEAEKKDEEKRRRKKARYPASVRAGMARGSMAACSAV